jgi:transposase
VPEQVQTVIGEDVSERLDVTPAKFRVIVTRRPKYAYRDRDGVIQAPAPSHLIESGLATSCGAVRRRTTSPARRSKALHAD